MESALERPEGLVNASKAGALGVFKGPGHLSATQVLTSLRRRGSLSHPEDVRVAIRALGQAAFWQEVGRRFVCEREEGLQLLHGMRAPYRATPRMYSVWLLGA